jgi:hypothetical protein
MQTEDQISTDELCIHYHVERSFVQALHENGLIEINTIEKTGFMPAQQLPDFERMTRLHYDLDINLEGIEAINHLLQRVKEMQDQIRQLENKLHIYE